MRETANMTPAEIAGAETVEPLHMRAIREAAREGVSVEYRLLLLRQQEHADAGRFAQASECAAIRHELEKIAAISRSSTPPSETRHE